MRFVWAVTWAHWRYRLCVALFLVLAGSACQPAPQTTLLAQTSPPLPESTEHLVSPMPSPSAVGIGEPFTGATPSPPQGVTPIGIARKMVGSVLVIEGTATMCGGGFYAGSGNVKFYVQDESGGIQVQVFGGEGKVEVPIGARVRVRGRIDAYRGAIQIVPADVLSDITVVAYEDDREITPMALSLADALNPQAAPFGRLVQVSGVLTGLSETSFNDWVELSDEQGHGLSVCIDKLTHINLEGLQPGRRYRFTGILEARDGMPCLYPRQQADLAEAFPSALRIHLQVAPVVRPGAIFTTTLNVANHSDQPVQQAWVEIPLPRASVQLERVLDGGGLQGGVLHWLVPHLEAQGGNAMVRAVWRAGDEPGTILWQGYRAGAEGWNEVFAGEAFSTVVGDEVPICIIQGRGFASPLLMERVTTQGILIGVFPELGGFWIQSTRPDGDPNTSEGIFVDTDGTEMALLIGDVVRVSGQVRETYQQTTLVIGEPQDVQLLKRGNSLPPAQTLNPPPDEQAAQVYYESLEGMLVQVGEEAIAVSPTSKYGEYALVLSSHGIERVGRGMPSGWLIQVDDGSNRVHRDRAHLSYVVYSGDRVNKVLGPLAFTFGQYKVEPIILPEVVHRVRELPSLSLRGEEAFRLMTWNPKNLFDPYPPHPEDLPLPSPEEYEVALAKVAHTIVAGGAPDVVALQEVENSTVLEALVSHPALAPFAYRPVLVEGSDPRGIDVAYLVRQDGVELLEIRQVATPKELTTRPMLLLRLRIGAEPNNHFTALSDGESESQPRQTAQAVWVAEIVKSLLATEPQACLAVMGDLNAFPDSPPITTLLQVGLEDPFKHLPETERYTYIYQGISQTLDYILVTPCLMDLLERADVLRLNADYPPPLPNDTSPEHKSDHDAVVITFSYP